MDYCTIQASGHFPSLRSLLVISTKVWQTVPTNTKIVQEGPSFFYIGLRSILWEPDTSPWHISTINNHTQTIFEQNGALYTIVVTSSVSWNLKHTQILFCKHKHHFKMQILVALTSFKWRRFALFQNVFKPWLFACEISSFSFVQSLQTANLWKVLTYRIVFKCLHLCLWVAYSVCIRPCF
jgi:hypothetical protein